jgi:hypothetical protein
MKNKLPLILLLVLFVMCLLCSGFLSWYVFFYKQAMPGSDRDAHGCIGSAGYTWCGAKNKCLRTWEEPCLISTDNPGTACEVTNCHGMDIQCGAKKPEACTMMYQLGDGCLQFAECAVQNGQCQELVNQKFLSCKSCVENCQLESNNNVGGGSQGSSGGTTGAKPYFDVFSCESKCIN